MDPVRLEPPSRGTTSLASEASGASHMHDNNMLSEGFAFADDLDGNDAHGQLTGYDKCLPFDLQTTQTSPLTELVTFDELFAFDDVTWGQQQCSEDVSLALHGNVDQQPGSWCTWMRSDISLSVMTESPSMISNQKLAAAIQSGRPHAQHSADVILQSLRSFPTMLRLETFPWFIHPYAQLPAGPTGAAALPESLSNCMSIAQMFALRTPETKHVLRRTVRAEHRRFTSEVRFLLIPYSAFLILILRNTRCTTCPIENSSLQCKPV